MKKIIFLILLMVVAVGFSCPSLGAEDIFQVGVETVVNDVFPTQTAKFLVTITNLQEEDDEFKLSFGTTVKWSLTTDPISYLSGINLDAGETVTFPLFLQASGDGLSYGMKSFAIGVKSQKTGLPKELSLQLLLRNPTPANTKYLPTIGFNVDIEEEIDARKPAVLKLFLDNKNPLDIEKVVVSVRSDLYNIDRTIPLKSLEKKTEVFTINYDPGLKPTEDIITVKVKVGDIDFTPVTKYIKIVGYKDLEEKEELSKSFLKKRIDYTYTNNGNVKDKKDVKIETSLLAVLFTKTTPKAAIVKDEGGRSLTWDFELEPGQSKTITMTKNYRPLFYVLILIIIGSFAYYLFRSPILIRKDTKVLRIEDEGVSHLKVLLHVKNRTKKAVDEVRLIDRIPQIAKLDTDYAIGTLQPDKVIRHEHKGTILKWNISTLEPYEERIISYNIISRLNIIGGVCLPPSVLKFKGKGKQLKKILSNKTVAK